MNTENSSPKLSSKTLCQILKLKTDMLVHAGEKPYSCGVCQKSWSQFSQLKAHMQIHLVEEPFRCTVCAKLFKSKPELKTHCRTHREKRYSCKVCQKKFISPSKVNQHMRTHTGEKPFRCAVCDKTFSSDDGLKSHFRTHTGEKPYLCQVCQRPFSQKASANTHMRIHTGEKPYRCTVCGKPFKSRQELTTHFRKHTGEKPYSCKVCRRTFSQLSSMKTHMRIHTGEKPYRCTVCKGAYTSAQALINHMRIHHPEKQNSGSAGPCENTWTPALVLKTHVEIDTTERPNSNGTYMYKKTFVTKECEEKHTITHEEDIPCSDNVAKKTFWQDSKPETDARTNFGSQYNCHLCQKTFTDMLHLGRHNKATCTSHMKEKPNSSVFCEKTFATKDAGEEPTKKHKDEGAHFYNVGTKSFWQVSKIDTDERTNLDGQYICPLCQKYVAYMSSLAIHKTTCPSRDNSFYQQDDDMKRVFMLSFARFGCCVCDRLFVDEASFRLHCNRHQ